MICMMALLPGLFLTAGPDTAPALHRAGIEQFCAPPSAAPTWKQAGFQVTALSDQDLHKRVELMAPGIDRKVFVASATTAPWVNGNGWRIRREMSHGANPGFWYDVSGGSVPLAAAEAFAYGADAVLKIGKGDIEAYGKMLAFFRSLPEKQLPDVADFGFIDNGSDDAGEILNLLSRRNLLYKIVQAPDPKLRFTVPTNSDDPHLFAAKVRERLTDEQRSLRVYGSEVVLCRLTGNGSQARVHVLNYGRKVDGVRLRIRGTYKHAKLYQPDSTGDISDFTTADGFTEFSLPELGAYAVIDLT